MNREEYNNIKGHLNYSSLKAFEEDRMKFKRVYIDGHYENNVSSYYMNMGNAVETLLFEEELFYEQFAVATCERPTGQWGELLDHLAIYSQQFVEENELTIEENDLIRQGFDDFKYNNPDKFKRDTAKTILKKFIEPGRSGIVPLDYYHECIANFGRTVIDEKFYNNAEKIRDSIKFGKYTSEVFILKENEEAKYQECIQYEINGVPIKSLMDKIIINHKEKYIIPFDLKVTWDAEHFDNMYKKNKYYLQGAMYTKGLRQLYPDYDVKPMQFIVGSSTGKHHSFIKSMTESNIEEGLRGFVDARGYYYRGAREILDDIEHCMASGDFKDSVELSKNLGVLDIVI